MTPMEPLIKALPPAVAKGALSCLPVIGPILVQGLDKIETTLREERLHDFVHAFRVQVEENEVEFEDVRGQLRTQQELLRQTISVVLRAMSFASRAETHEEARRFGNVAATAARDRSCSARMQLNAIDALDHLSDGDFDVLLAFAKRGPIRVTELEPAVRDTTFGELIASLSKLESRGLVSESGWGASVTGIERHRDSGHWIERWRNRCYELLPLGEVLLRLASGGKQPAI